MGETIRNDSQKNGADGRKVIEHLFTSREVKYQEETRDRIEPFTTEEIKTAG